MHNFTVDERLTEERMNAWLPLDTRCWRDTWNSRWQLFLRSRRINSYARGRYGYVEAARLSLLYMWALHVEGHGGAVPAGIARLGRQPEAEAEAGEARGSA